MDQQPRKELTIVQLMSLIALLGIGLTIAAWLWPAPGDGDQSNAAVEQNGGIAESQ